MTTRRAQRLYRAYWNAKAQRDWDYRTSTRLSFRRGYVDMLLLQRRKELHFHAKR